MTQSSSTPAAACSDGAGGAFIVNSQYTYGSPTDFDIAVQHIIAAGTTAWLEVKPVCMAVRDQTGPVIVADGSGGFYVAWLDVRVASGHPGVYAQRFTAAGVPLWENGTGSGDYNGIPIDAEADDTMVDGYLSAAACADGDLLLTWMHSSSSGASVRVQRVSGFGVTTWAANGALLNDPAVIRAALSQVCDDGAGGAVVVARLWDPEVEGSSVVVGRLLSGGTWAWKVNPVTHAARCDYPRLVRAGADHVITVWEDDRTLGMGTGVYANKLALVDGAKAWGADGVEIVAQPIMPSSCRVASDGSGGVIAAWEDGLDSGIFADRLDSSGARLWGTGGGTCICDAGVGSHARQVAPAVCGDGAGGAYLSWSDGRGWEGQLYGQHVSAAGSLAWGTSHQGLPIGFEPIGGPLYGGTVLVSSSDGKAIGLFGGRPGSSIVAQKVGDGGAAPFPHLDSVTQTAVMTADYVTLYGYYFGDYDVDTCKVMLGDTEVEIIDAPDAAQWFDTSIVIRVPAGVSGTLPVKVVSALGESNTLSLAVSLYPVPALTGITPDPTYCGSDVVISGTDLGLSGAGCMVEFGSDASGWVSGGWLSWSEMQIGTKVPAGLSPGVTGVRVTTLGGTSNTIAFTVLPPPPQPHTIAIAPARATIGSTVTIIGSGFGETRATSNVRFFTKTAAIVSWSDTAIECRVPAGIWGIVSVEVRTIGGYDGDQAFSVKPKLTGLSPSSGRPGTVVTLAGSGFGPRVWETTKVLIGGKRASVVSWSTTKVKVRVPKLDRGRKAVRLSTSGGTSSARYFTVK